MKILHVCLAAFYIDDFGYQENILPKMHKKQGHEVSILASTETYINNFTLGYIDSKRYETKDKIPIYRIPYVSFLPKILVRKLRIYKYVYNEIISFKPDIIFIHDLQFLSIFQICKYAKYNKNVKIIVDCHTDYINSARTWISKYLLHKVIYRICANAILPYTEVFYGVLPAREVFLNEVYKIPKEKIQFLPLGADLTEIDLNNKYKIKTEIRRKHGLNDDDFVIITGGKIDKKKNIHLLIQSFQKLNLPSTKLIVFGKIEIGLLDHKQLSDVNIIYIDWINSIDISKLFLSSDLSCFPGEHSVLWEHSIALGLPGIFRKWDGMDHIDLGGNICFLEESTEEGISNAIKKIVYNKELYDNMKKIADEKGNSSFSYFEIAKKAIAI